jgi:hypothetical protein
MKIVDMVTLLTTGNQTFDILAVICIMIACIAVTIAVIRRRI